MRGVEAAREPTPDVSLGRVVGFTDGVFAIAITLLVLNFDPPEPHVGTDPELGRYLIRELAEFGAYFLTFAVLGRFWVVHHRLFSRLRWADARLVSVNLTYLALIVLMPFLANLLSDYGARTLPVVMYASVLGAASILNWLMVRYSMRAGLIHSDHREAAESAGRIAALSIPAVFLASVPVAFFSPLAAEVMWVLLVLVRGAQVWGTRRSSDGDRGDDQSSELAA
jgi:uncharacterized membrane protein